MSFLCLLGGNFMATSHRFPDRSESELFTVYSSLQQHDWLHVCNTGGRDRCDDGGQTGATGVCVSVCVCVVF